MVSRSIRVADDYASAFVGPGISSFDPIVESAAVSSTRAPLGSNWIYAFLISWTLLHFSQFSYLTGKEVWNQALVLARYMLWPSISILTIIHVVRHGARDIHLAVRPFWPFLVIGIMASLLGFYPPYSLRLVLFWLLGVMAAATAGSEVAPGTVRKILFWTFVAFLSVSLLVVLLKPELGVSHDSRVESGHAWRGLFPGKNLTGLICVYGLLMAIFAHEVARPWRIAGGILAIVFLVFTRSQGSLVTAAAAVSFMVLIAALRRTSVSTVVKAILLVSIAGLATVTFSFVGNLLLSLIGRDLSLTGRTIIWRAFLQRASLYWPTGAGPGSFSLEGSPVIADLSYALAKYGRIFTPHNMFITAFGETGIFGLLAFALPLFYLAAVLPFRSSERAVLPVSVVAFTMIVGGMSEAREVFGVGMNMFLLILLTAVMRRTAREAMVDEMVPSVADHEDVGVPLVSDPGWHGPRVLG